MVFRGDTPTPRLVSQEEYNYRWIEMKRKKKTPLKKFNKKIREIREETGKP